MELDHDRLKADLEAALVSDGYHNRWFLDPLFGRSYPDDLVGLFAAHDAPVSEVIRDGDLAAIAAPIDFLGMNYYRRDLITASAEGLGVNEDLGAASPPGERNDMGWSFAPAALTEQLTRLERDYPRIPLYVTENGTAVPDVPDASGFVDDPRRVAYLRSHLGAVRAAMDAGVDVRGYFVWSLLDNFEWGLGYRPRFGIVRVDYDTQRRTPKASARWYAEVIANHRLDN